MRLSRALKEKRLQYQERHDKVILQHDNARPHVAKPVKTYLETLKWEKVKKWIDLWIASKDASFFRNSIRKLPERLKKVVASDEQSFES